jgi:hypothetical protein
MPRAGTCANSESGRRGRPQTTLSVRGQSGTQLVTADGARLLAAVADHPAPAAASGDNVCMYFTPRKPRPRGLAAHQAIGADPGTPGADAIRLA